MLEEEIRAGAPKNADGTINLVHYAAWLTLKPGDLLTLLNSTPLGEVCDERSLRRIRQGYGLRIGNVGTVDLLRYSARLRLDRQTAPNVPPPKTDVYTQARERIRQQRERLELSTATETNLTGTLMDTRQADSVPVAPFNSGGSGSYSFVKQLRDDIAIAKSILKRPLYPSINDGMRYKMIEWLELVLEASIDDRARVRAVQALLAADRANLVREGLELREKLAFAQMQLKEYLALKRTEETKPSVTAVQVNVNVDGTSKSETTVFERLRNLENFYAGLQSAPAGPVEGDGAGK